MWPASTGIHTFLSVYIPPELPQDRERLHELGLRLADLIYGRCDELFELPLGELRLAGHSALPAGRDPARVSQTAGVVSDARRPRRFRITLHQGFLEVISWNAFGRSGVRRTW